MLLNAGWQEQEIDNLNQKRDSDGFVSSKDEVDFPSLLLRSQSRENNLTPTFRNPQITKAVLRGLASCKTKDDQLEGIF